MTAKESRSIWRKIYHCIPYKSHRNSPKIPNFSADTPLNNGRRLSTTRFSVLQSWSEILVYSLYKNSNLTFGNIRRYRNFIRAVKIFSLVKRGSEMCYPAPWITTHWIQLRSALSRRKNKDHLHCKRKIILNYHKFTLAITRTVAPTKDTTLRKVRKCLLLYSVEHSPRQKELFK